MTRHSQVCINGIDVDEGIAPLLKVLWEKGYRTQYSCQGNPDYAYILFGSFCQANEFLCETAILMTNEIPMYWEHDLDRRNRLGHNVLCDSQMRLTLLDPADTETIRGAVEMSWRALPWITELWVNNA